jgi:replicative superfamily II helicase
VVALPTSAGKTRIAEICSLVSLAAGQRVFGRYPSQSALSANGANLRDSFAPLGFTVSSLYGAAGTGAGDLDTLGNRDIVIATP